MTAFADILGALGWQTVLAGLGVCFLAGALGGLSGYGAGMLATTFVAPVVGPAALIPVISVLMLVNNASRVWFYRHAVDLRTVARLSMVAVPMAWIGAQFYVRMDSALIQTLLGAVLIASVPLRRLLRGREVALGPAGVYGIGAAFGFLSSLIVGAGMLVVPMLMGVGFIGPALLATDAALAVAVNLAKAVIFGALDALTPGHFLFALAMGLATVPGTACAAWIVRRTSIRLHTMLIEGLILLGGATMLAGALGG
jgi:uncharacterized membrane protein YfcA